MSAASSLTTLSQPLDSVMLTILSGAESGVAYKLMGQSITLGRDVENDVVLQDVKASRRHAKLELRDGNYWIKDLGSRSGIIVNGTPTIESLLRIGDQLVIGSTLVRFGTPQALSLVNTAPAMPQPIFSAPHVEPLAKSQPPRKQQKQNKKSFAPWIIGGVIAASLVIFLQDSNTKKKHFDIHDDEALDSQLEDMATNNEKQQQMLLKNGHDTQQYRTAQNFYQRGFREFREGNFARAIQNFEASLAIYPSHPLARRYLERSKQKLDLAIAQSIERGEKNFQQGRYNLALNDYRTVLLLRNDQRDKIYQLALKRIESINLIFRNTK
jgi:pSer/pThr/pTyr-binding forkhead associated (FHA) protein